MKNFAYGFGLAALIFGAWVYEFYPQTQTIIKEVPTYHTMTAYECVVEHRELFYKDKFKCPDPIIIEPTMCDDSQCGCDKNYFFSTESE